MRRRLFLCLCYTIAALLRCFKPLRMAQAGAGCAFRIALLPCDLLLGPLLEPAALLLGTLRRLRVTQPLLLRGIGRCCTQHPPRGTLGVWHCALPFFHRLQTCRGLFLALRIVELDFAHPQAGLVITRLGPHTPQTVFHHEPLVAHRFVALAPGGDSLTRVADALVFRLARRRDGPGLLAAHTLAIRR